MANPTATDDASPKRYIFNDMDLQAFLVSPTKESLLKFTLAMGQSCASNELTTDEDETGALSPGLAVWLGALEGMQEWLTEIPLETGEVRFGNPAFRTWHERLVERAPHIFRTILSVTKSEPLQVEGDYDAELLAVCRSQGKAAAGSVEEADVKDDADDATTKVLVQELCAYIHDAFGHPIRLDYGTGHESSFQITLYALFQLNVFGNDYTKNQVPTKRRLKAATLAIYKAYLTITRGLQKDYRLEPAGSHGVWGLDDYHCLPFYFGAQQLAAIGNDSKPSDIYQKSAAETKQYLYYGCIAFIQELKSKAPFHETSPMLHDISGIAAWSKVAAGLWKLYEGEVLSKRPVVQHWVFGPKLFPATWTASQAAQRAAPTETFRPLYADRGSRPHGGEHPTGAMPPAATGVPPTRAPWAK